MYGIGEKGAKGIDDARHNLFVKAKRDLEVLPQTHGALDLTITKATYQAKILLQAYYAIMNLVNIPAETVGWREGTDGLEVVLKRLLAIPDA